MGILYVPVGIPGSGKSTYGKTMDAHIVSSDSIRKELYGSEKIQGDAAQVFAIAYERAANILKSGGNVYFDATNLGVSTRRTLLRKVGKHADKIIAVYFDVPYEVCLNRNRNRARRVPIRVMQRMARNIRVPDLAEGFDQIVKVR